jgi:hypothetical protein
MPMLGAAGFRSRALSFSGAAAKAWAKLAQLSLARPGPALRATSMRSR